MSVPSDFPEEEAAAAGRAHHGRRGYYVVAGVLVVAVGGGGTAAFVMNDQGGPTKPASTRPSATAAITRGDIVDTESVDGSLTYADERTIAPGASGTVTWAPDEGATITRGKPLLKVDGKPVTLMYGSLPLYRPLRPGVDDGADVEQLERNLRALGYGDDMTVDDSFTAATAAAVQDWQDDKGLPETGGVDASQVVFASGAVRIGEVKAALGDRVRPGGPALTVTGTERIVHVDLDAAKQDIAKEGAAVTVELPGGDEVKGRIIDVGTVAETSGGDNQNPDDDTATVDVDIKVSGKGLGRLDEAPVTVEMESERSENVLSVPIEALLALREGGFGVEVVEGATSRIVAVELGTYGGGRVEITGSGLREGMKVGVAAS
ncbi:MAG TPA: peptidoglycan-binding protein [Streptosporangiaceae bacterium]|nr:peptidoglycan-binding protein [Streptosporangiaceae bacterium]